MLKRAYNSSRNGPTRTGVAPCSRTTAMNPNSDQAKDGVMVTAASRGQEFVLDCDDYPEAINWLAKLLKLATP